MDPQSEPAMMKRAEQIEFMESAEQRNLGYLERWLSNPEFRASLHRYDRDGSGMRPCRVVQR